MTDDGSNRLPVLAEEIRKAHSDVEAANKTATERAIDAGKALAEAKALLDHGQWIPWLTENCAIAVRTAQAYMQLAKTPSNPDDANAQRVAHLSLREALRKSAAVTSRIEKLSPVDRDRVLEMIEGENLTATEAVRRFKMQSIRKSMFAVPTSLIPDTTGRKTRVLVNRDTKQVCLVIGPNEASLRLRENLELLKPEFSETEVDDIKARADALERQAKELRKQADAFAKAQQLALPEELEKRHGPAFHFIETFDYDLSDDDWQALNELSSPDDVAEFLRPRQCKKRGWWGDVKLMGYGAHDITASGGDGWDAIGSPEWLQEAFPEMEKP